jgi:TusA-related sulfurtransferase
MNRPPIDPETRVAELLANFPEAEDVLIGLAPQFKALKNPVLRRTVAKVATLEQAAKVGGVPVRELVMTLRRELGVDGGEIGEGAAADWTSEVPAWVDREAVATIDGGALLDAGETPIAKAAAALAEMERGQVLVVSAPFQPAPMLDSLRGKGHEVFAQEEPDATWRVWIRKA